MNVVVRDPVEKTIEYANAMMKVLPILDKEYRIEKTASTSYWKRKQELLKNFGVNWARRADLNDEIKD